MSPFLVQPQSLRLARSLRPTLPTMFEEDAERCFICQVQCKGLYCSAECRMQDRGTLSPAVKPLTAAPRVTAQLPPSLSPLVRPTYHITPSSRMPAHVASGSDSSSLASSPIESPQTNPTSTASPHRETFNLPPPAFPSHMHQSVVPGSVPVRIPLVASRPVSAPLVPTFHVPASHGSTAYPGASIETLHFGRKPSATNSVTSPTALNPRCACGKSANHPGRPSSRELAALDPGFSIMNLAATERGQSRRLVSDPAIKHTADCRASYQVTPANISSVSTVLEGSLTLSRSRSDPMPASPKHRPNPFPSISTANPSAIIPSHRGAEPTRETHVGIVPSGGPPRSRDPAALAASEYRGRSRERQVHRVEASPNGLLNHPTNRENAPSRSRHRREERRRAEEQEERIFVQREQDQQQPARETLANVTGRTFQHGVPQILPSWSRRTSASHLPNDGGEGVAPRRTGSGEAPVPHTPTEEESGEVERQREKRAAKLQKAGEQLGQVFGVAAGARN